MVINSLAGPLTIPDVYAELIFDAWEPCEHSFCRPAGVQALVFIPTDHGPVTLCGHHGDSVPGATELPGSWRYLLRYAPISELDSETEGGQAVFV